MASLTRFYQENGVWHLGGKEAVTPGFYSRNIIGSDGQVTITDQNRPYLPSQHWNQFCDATGTAYATLAAFRLATDDFFKTNTVSIAALAFPGLTDAEMRATPVPTVVKDSSGVEAGEKIVSIKSVITLPANMNAYAAGDVITDISGLISKFTDVAKAIGRPIIHIATRIQSTEATGLGGKTFNVHFYNDSVTPIADNSPFVISNVNTDKREGKVLITMGAVGSTTTKVGMTDTTASPIAMIPVSRDVYFILETVEGFTPTANSVVFNVYSKWLIQ